VKNKPIRILNIVPDMKAAGVETLIMNMYRNIDRSKVQFDFIVHSQERQFYDDEIEKLNGKIYRFSYKDDKNFFKYIRDLENFFDEHKEYKIVHGHMQSMMPIYLKIAKKKGVKVRIAHSHNNSYEKSLKGFVLHILSRFSKKYSNMNFACSKLAGKYLFGSMDFEVINNAIDLDKFYFEKRIRSIIRKKYGIKENEILIGNVGRMEKQKNQLFLVDVFEECLKHNSNYKLIIIGKGKLEKEIIKKVKEKNIESKVVFLKDIKNVNELMQAMDIFALPSLYEGLGIVLIEAQMSGLKCYATANTIAEETNITKNIDYIPLEKKIWVNKILNTDIAQDRFIEKNQGKEFDIKNISKKLEEKYISMYNE